jgi:hypothetical protein
MVKSLIKNSSVEELEDLGGLSLISAMSQNRQDYILGQNFGEDSDSPALWCLRTSEHTALIVIPIIKEGMEDKTNVFERVGFVRHWVREEWTWFDEEKEKTTVYLV